MKNIVFCGGDGRELLIMRELAFDGYRITACGWPKEQLPDGVSAAEDADVALREADVCILPQPPIGMDWRLPCLGESPLFLRPEDISLLRDGTPLFCGVAPAHLRKAAARCRIFAAAEDASFAAAIAPACAEGAVAEGINLTDGLLADGSVLLIGYGRIGRELARRLRGLDAQPVVLDCDEKKADEAVAAGYPAADRSQLRQAALHADIIFNTAPALLLDAGLIAMMRRDTCIIDLASAPGGTDFAAAERQGIKAVHATGLPGRYAPGYAGKITVAYYRRLLTEIFKEAHNDDT